MMVFAEELLSVYTLLGLALERVPLAKLRKLQIFLCFQMSAAGLQHVGLIAYAGSAPSCSADVAIAAEYLAQLALSVLRFAYIGCLLLLYYFHNFLWINELDAMLILVPEALLSQAGAGVESITGDELFI
ncbi:hypothetical protein Nepgr_002614 [Nepenthes gracilis]|uniref:Uncharacterized protein n=1 Tax=Nepenthes gracilis TaxID=150966 RepID=A0AAD3P849_NEPGR|nr:hypothetical protein Nepgr_002614 [Nepenthes gracilis]